MDTARNSGIDVSKTLGSGGPAGSYFPDPGHYQQQKSRRRKWLVLGVGFAFLGLAIAGATVGGIIRSRRAAKTDLANTSANASIGGGDGADVVKQSDPSDPSTFIKDPNLHQSFYGIAYSPQNSQLPGCGATLPEVITDIQLLAQLTKRIRLYGADCNQTALVLEAIQQTKVDMQVWLGNYPIPTDGGEAYVRQRDLIRDALTTYGADHISGITVGNEFMLNYITSHNSSNPNSAIGNQGAALLISNITDTRNMLRSMNLHTTIPVGNSDAGSYFNNHVLAAIDYGLANVHPWFANVSIQQSGAWTTNFFESVDIAAANAQSNKPKMYIAETGWPSKSSDVAHASNGPSRASIGNLQSYLDTFVCQANSAGTPYFYFELYDEAWKDAQFGGVEGWWGLFTANRTLKVKIPSCLAP
ncbi:glycoside hydrolase superfamily [Coprinopsis sp. MPI-PUGE-AT-0042]|nr:glycoside hydrolase superfamily [Coprinopsis sp. MPI-PUGE-AT-0042]